MDKVGGEIGYVYGTTVGKVIKYGVNEKFGGSLGWNVGSSFLSWVNKGFGGEVSSVDDGRVGFKVGGEADSENGISFSKYVKYEVNVKVDGSVGLDVYRYFDSGIYRSIGVKNVNAFMMS